jgi:hypothetical protein
MRKKILESALIYKDMPWFVAVTDADHSDYSIKLYNVDMTEFLKASVVQELIRKVYHIEGVLYNVEA